MGLLRCTVVATFAFSTATNREQVLVPRNLNEPTKPNDIE
jgi:hypothetical protein